MRENRIAKILFYIGLAQFGIGIIIGIALINTESEYGIVVPVQWSQFWYPVIGGFIFGMIFIGFSEVIKLLHTINGKMKPLERMEESIEEQDQEQDEDDHKNDVNWFVSKVNKEEIKQLYKHDTVIDIIPSILEGYCVVLLQGEKEKQIEIVDVAGFFAVKLNDEVKKDRIMSWYTSIQGEKTD